jgi:hypothetical protein
MGGVHGPLSSERAVHGGVGEALSSPTICRPGPDSGPGPDGA